MALGFGRKKAADDTPVSVDAPVGAVIPDPDAAPVAAHAPSSPHNAEADAFDFTTLEAPQKDANAPIASASGGNSGSAFDFPIAPDNDEEDAIDFDKLYAIEQQNAAQSGIRNAAPAPFVPPTATIQESDTPFYEPQILVETAEQPKKKLPLVPILGGVAVLALAGGAASYFASQGGDETQNETPVAVQSAPRVVKNPPRVVSAPAQTGATAPRPAGLTGASAVSPGIAPAKAQNPQLKALWKRGADAKHRGDYAGARRYWSQGLKIEPSNLGFRQSIAKLPR